MTTDTIFDLASLTKPIATATSVLLLVEQGQLDLEERVATYLPEFGQNGKEAITVLQLLTHQGGLTPDNELGDYADGPAQAWERICGLGVRAAPGKKFMYSDVGFIVLGELVRRVSGEGLDQFAQQRIFQPLGMQETMFLPGESLAARAAPTETTRRPLDAGGSPRSARLPAGRRGRPRRTVFDRPKIWRSCADDAGAGNWQRRPVLAPPIGRYHDG